MPRHLRPIFSFGGIVAAVVCVLLVGCGPSDEDDDVPTVGGDTDASGCPYKNDGTCDEPGRCPLGTDDADCREACQESDAIGAFVAACEHRDLLDEENAPPPEHPNYENPDSSEGSSHLTGWRDGTVEVPLGESTSSTAPRHFRVYVPRDYDPEQSYPLMITMPGHRVSHWVMGGFTMLHRTANMNDFIVVYAGQEFWSRAGHWHWWTEWYGSEMSDPPDLCRQRGSDSHPDYAFIRKLIDWSSAEYNVDQRRVYLSGHSRGAATALMAALDMPERIAGAAVESGYTECGYLDEIVGEENWSERRPTLVFVHGTEDDDVCIDCAGDVKSCEANSSRSCAPGQYTADAMVERFSNIGWEKGTDLKYYRLKRVAHDWQTHLNQQVWDFLADRPLPAGE